MQPAQVELRDERRRYQRVAVQVPATVQWADDLISATLRNISRSGAAVELGNPRAVPQGDPVVLAGDGTVLRGWGAKVVDTAGTRLRLVFDATLPAMDLMGVARAVNQDIIEARRRPHDPADYRS